jgi:hypothetical protein
MKIEKKINWRLFVRNRRFLLYAVGVIVLSLGLVLKASVPLVSSILSADSELKEKNKSVRQLEQKAESLRNLQAGDVVAKQQLVNQILPSRKPVLELLTSLNVVAGQTGVSFIDFQVSPGEIASDSTAVSPRAVARKNKDMSYDTVSVQLTAVGTFQQVQEFLRKTEQLAPLTTVTDLNLSIKRKRVGVVEENDAVSAELVLDTYFYTQSLKAALAAPLPALNQQHEDLLAQLGTFMVPTYSQQQEIISSGVLDLFGVTTLQPE